MKIANASDHAGCHGHYFAHQGIEHDNLNVLVMGGRVIGESVALELVRAFLHSKYDGEDRHQRRLEKVKAITRQRGRAK